MMDHLSSNVCAAAASTYIPIQAGIVAIASILEKGRMIASQAKQEQMDNAKS
jgi:hypothetical protein